MSGRLGIALTAACDAFGSTVAASSSSLVLSYADLAAHGRSVTTALRTIGVHANEPVHINVSNDPLDLAALSGVWQAGAVAVPVHRTTPAAVAANVDAKSGARFLVDMRAKTSDSRSVVSSIAPDEPPARPILNDATFIIFASGSTGTTKGVVVSHDAFHGKMQKIDSLPAFAARERGMRGAIAWRDARFAPPKPE